MLCNFCLFFKLCSSFFQQPSGDSGTRVPRVSPESLITIYIGERELALYIYATIHGPDCTKLLTRALFFGPCHHRWRNRGRRMGL